MNASLNRSLLLGFGAGCIAASVVIGVGLAATPQASAVQNVQELAKKNGLLVLTPSELQQKLSVVEQQGRKSEAAQNSTVGSESTKTTEKTPVSGDKVWVAIQSGLSIDETADLLLKAGVITNRSSFLSATNRSSHFIRAGVYDLPYHSNALQTLRILTMQ